MYPLKKTKQTRTQVIGPKKKKKKKRKLGKKVAKPQPLMDTYNKYNLC